MLAPIVRRIQKGSTSQSVLLRFTNQISFVPQLSLSEGTAGLVVKYWRQGPGTSAGTGDVSIVAVSLATLSSAYNSGGVKAITDGWYRLDVPDAALANAAGINGVLITASATGIVSSGVYVELTDYNPNTNTPQTTPEKY